MVGFAPARSTANQTAGVHLVGQNFAREDVGHDAQGHSSAHLTLDKKKTPAGTVGGW